MFSMSSSIVVELCIACAVTQNSTLVKSVFSKSNALVSGNTGEQPKPKNT